jgi:hypothetical protein
LEFWGRFDAGRSNLPGLRLLASDQGLRLASQSRGYLQKDDGQGRIFSFLTMTNSSSGVGQNSKGVG